MYISPPLHNRPRGGKKGEIGRRKSLIDGWSVGNIFRQQPFSQRRRNRTKSIELAALFEKRYFAASVRKAGMPATAEANSIIFGTVLRHPARSRPCGIPYGIHRQGDLNDV